MLRRLLVQEVWSVLAAMPVGAKYQIMFGNTGVGEYTAVYYSLYNYKDNIFLQGFTHWQFFLIFFLLN